MQLHERPISQSSCRMFHLKCVFGVVKKICGRISSTIKIICRKEDFILYLYFLDFYVSISSSIAIAEPYDNFHSHFEQIIQI